MFEPVAYTQQVAQHLRSTQAMICNEGSNDVSEASPTVVVDRPMGGVNMFSLARELSSVRQPCSSTALEFCSASSAMSGNLRGIRWTFGCMLLNLDVEFRGGHGKKGVATLLTVDRSGPLLISVWGSTVETCLLYTSDAADE